jgi:hypothetical protein
MDNSISPAGDPAKHHYIPEFYLKWWTGHDGRLERYTQPIPGGLGIMQYLCLLAGFFVAHKVEIIEQAIAMDVRELARSMNLSVVENARHFVGALDRPQDRFIRNRIGRQT